MIIKGTPDSSSASVHTEGAPALSAAASSGAVDFRYNPLFYFRKKIKFLAELAGFCSCLYAIVVFIALNAYKLESYFGHMLVILLLLVAIAYYLIQSSRKLLIRRSGTIRVDESGLWLPNTGYVPAYLRIPWRDLLSGEFRKDQQDRLRSFCAELLGAEFTAVGRGDARVVLKFNSAGWPDNLRKQMLYWGPNTGFVQELHLELSAISARNHRRFFAALQRFAPGESLSSLCRQQLKQIESGTSFTELWLDSLRISAPRKSSSQLLPGTRLCDQRFEIVRTVGSGGQGTAYEAMDHYADIESGEQARVILKEFILPVHGDEQTAIQSLQAVEREADILRHVACDSIVRLYDTFVDDYRAYLVIEFINGQSLKELVQQEGALEERAAATLAIQMCEILQHLHSLSPAVVHRDFTPENLLLTADGKLKLIDFDVAHQLDEDCGTHVVGKPSYIAPEQFRGQALQASDIYSMGATLYFLLTAHDPTPIKASQPRNVIASISEEFDRIVSSCTAVAVESRYSRVQEVIAELKRFLEKNNEQTSA